MFKDKRGYVMLYNPNRSIYPNGYILRSHMVYEDTNKCCILPWAIVHHRNEIVDDDSISNLELLSREDHARHHQRDRPDIDMSGRICGDCNSPNTYTRKKTGNMLRPEWYRLGSGFLCGKCYMRRCRLKRGIT